MSNGNQHTEKRHLFTMYNKAPLWNESSQVYQLDFGGRVTQESAKNFQIEFKGKQVRHISQKKIFFPPDKLSAAWCEYR